jgi:hypothetical protein
MRSSNFLSEILRAIPPQIKKRGYRYTYNLSSEVTLSGQVADEKGKEVRREKDNVGKLRGYPNMLFRR